MICSVCGHEIADNMRFCTFCGASAAEAVPAPPVETPLTEATGPVFPPQEPAAEIPGPDGVFGFAPQEPAAEIPGPDAVFGFAPQEPAPLTDPFPAAPPQPAPEKKTSGGKVLPWILFGAVTVLLIAAIVFGFFCWKQLSGDRNALTSDKAQLLDDVDTARNEIAKLKDDVAERDALITEKDGTIAGKDAEIAERDDLISEKDKLLDERDRTIAEKTGALADCEAQIAAQQESLAGKDEEIAANEARLSELESEKDALSDEKDAEIADLTDRLQEEQALKEALQGFKDSIVWNSKSFTLGGDEKYGAYPAVLRVKVGQEAFFTLYENYSEKMNPACTVSGIPVKTGTVLAAGEKWDGTVKFSLLTEETGIARLDFTNDIDDRTFSILVISVEP